MLSGYKFFVKYVCHEIFSPSLWLAFLSLLVTDEQIFLILMITSLSIIIFYVQCFLCSFKKSLSILSCQDILLFLLKDL